MHPAIGRVSFWRLICLVEQKKGQRTISFARNGTRQTESAAFTCNGPVSRQGFFMEIEMKELVQQCVVSNIFLDVFAPERDELASEDSLKVIENAFRLTDEELSSRVSRAIRLSAKASAEIEAAFPGI